ncbi:MAG: LysM peptidoglycan-binding domain-containing protein [Desulfobacterales bacterium]|nr:LysM peptidoglycan-binding domain-containing protein [Desulfobacterales bacterium]MDD4070825.1 LysM peptidoglycan-binding domain-containing protein [Desulfobacterales bacterium]
MHKKFMIFIATAFILIYLCSACAKQSHRPTVNGNAQAQPKNQIDETISDETVSIDSTTAFCLATNAAAPDKAQRIPADSDSSDQTVSAGTQPSFNDQEKDSDGYATEENPFEKFIQPKLDESLDYCKESQHYWQKGDFDNAIESLDQAYSLILDADTNDDPKLFQQKEDLRFMISKRILEIYASRNIVVTGNHNAIPLVLNKHIQNEIDCFTHQEKNFFIQSYKRAGQFRPSVLAALKEAGLPEELSWLPLIESGFKVTALSKARALGLWQFIPSTGYKFGLTRDMFTDERLDPVKSTHAAIAYLKELHNMFGDWTTVLAAYNCGEGRVLKLIRNQNINYLDNFWDLYEKLPQETARYVPRFLATLHIIKNLEKYGFSDIESDDPLEYDTITVAKQMRLKDIAAHIQEPEKLLVQLNPELRYKILPQETYTLKVPKGKAEIILSEIDNISISSPPEKEFVHHRVKHGETLSSIAGRYHTSVRKIMRVNHLKKSNHIVAGKKLKIPFKGTMVSELNAPSDRNKAIKSSIPSTHVVKRGDSLWIIAKRYATTTQKIQHLNKLNTTRLYIGQVLNIPGSADQKTADKGNLKTYCVKNGDNPFGICQYNNMSLERFLRINNLTSNSKIYPGQTVFVD